MEEKEMRQFFSKNYNIHLKFAQCNFVLECSNIAHFLINFVKYLKNVTSKTGKEN
jgi:hypothetical protein